LILSLLLAIALLFSGCVVGNKLVGDWQANVPLIGQVDLTFRADGTGTLSNKLGAIIFEYEVIDQNKIEYLPQKSLLNPNPEKEILEYEMINNNSMVFMDMTFAKKEK